MKKRDFSTIILVLILLVGLSLLLYPTVSDYWNSFHQSRAIVDYESTMANMVEEDYTEYFEEAQAYNERLRQINNPLENSELIGGYEEALAVTENGIMGYIMIPQINIEVPIYHGTSERVLSVGIGHIEGTTLPIGGENTHCALSGHRGLPSARLFTDLDKIVVGDLFMIRTLDTTMTYEVDQIRIVLPEELQELKIVEGEDLCTLVTCTPYGINTHRLLVRGHRIDNIEESAVRVTADAMQIETMIIAPIVAVPIILLLLVWVLVDTRSKKNRRKRHV